MCIVNCKNSKLIMDTNMKIKEPAINIKYDSEETA
ncbi:protein of unknown function [Clostridium beijerinckii]|nr:protein of unknown function [Clostridium beijerinckii]